MLGGPRARSVTRPGADRERGHDLYVRCMREIDHALPLLPGQNSVKSLGRNSKCGIIGVLEICGVRPSSAHSKIRRSKCLSQFAQARVRQIDGRSIFVKGGIHARRLIGGGLLICGRLGVRLAGIWFPESSTRYLNHLDVVRLKALIDRSDACHGRRGNGGLRRLPRNRNTCACSQHGQGSNCEEPHEDVPAHCCLSSNRFEKLKLLHEAAATD